MGLKQTAGNSYPVITAKYIAMSFISLFGTSIMKKTEQNKP